MNKNAIMLFTVITLTAVFSTHHVLAETQYEHQSLDQNLDQAQYKSQFRIIAEKFLASDEEALESDHNLSRTEYQLLKEKILEMRSEGYRDSDRQLILKML